MPQVSQSSGAPSETIAILEWAWSYTQVIEALLDELADGGADGPLDELDFDEFLAAMLSEDSDADIVEPPPVLAPVADAAPDFPVDDPPPLPPPLEPPPPVLLHPLPWYSCYLANGGKLSWYLRQYKWEATCKNPAHGKCVVTRSGGLKESNMWGRPLGLLSA